MNNEKYQKEPFTFPITLITPGIRRHGTGVGTKNAGVDNKSTNTVGIRKRSFLKHNNILQ
jgi:hypothetical protein